MRTTAIAAAVSACLVLAACERGAAPDPAAPRAAQSADIGAVATAGDVTVRANAMITGNLEEMVATRYGIERSPDTVMLLVTARRGPDGAQVSVPATVSATATDLRGQRQTIEMRPMASSAPVAEAQERMLDYVGIFRAELPDTLRFELQVRPEDGAPVRLEFTRELAPAASEL